MNYRNRKLLDASYKIDCKIQLPGICEGGPGEPAHSNWSRHGKGKSIKAHDCFFASACRACHRELDQGSKMSREERQDAWYWGYERTMLALWEFGLIEVK